MRAAISIGAIFLVFGVLIFVSNLFSFAIFTGTVLGIIGFLTIITALEDNIEELARKKDIEELKKELEEAKNDIKEIKADIIKNQSIHSRMLDYFKDKDRVKT